MKKAKRTAVRLPIVILIMLLVLSFTSVLSAATPPTPHMEPRASHAAIIREADTALLLEGESISFDIPTLPDATSNDKGGTVTNEATLVNPTSETVISTLLVPLFTEDYEREAIDKSAFSLSVDGVLPSVSVRYSYSSPIGTSFSIRKEADSLSDTLTDDSVYTPDTPVYEYVFDIFGLVRKDTECEVIAFFETELNSKSSRIITDADFVGGDYYMDADKRFYFSVEEGERISIFFVGEEPREPLEFKFYENTKDTNGYSEKNRIEGKAIQAEMDRTYSIHTFSDLVRHFRPQSLADISDIDWYNAVISFLNTDTKDYLTTELEPDYICANLLPWYQCALTVGAGERTRVLTSSPLYAGYDGGYTPYLYTYEYKLSYTAPAADDYTRDITINTPYYMPLILGEDYEAADGGFKLSARDSTDDRLYFCLCESADPDGYDDGLFPGVLILLAICAAAFFVVMLPILIIVLVIKSKMNL